MRFKSVATAVVAALSVSLLGTAGASAATEFGDACTGTDPAIGPYTVTTLAAPPAVLPLVAPTSGVITKVKMPIEAEVPITIPQAVKVLRPAGGISFTTVGEATIQVQAGPNVADVRLPVQAGDRLGVLGLPFTYEGSPIEGLSFYCKAPGDLGATKEPTPAGATAAYPRETEGRVPLAAILEPDADSDGFGDETQDKCPQSATTQAACPPVAFSTRKQVRKGSVTVVVTSSTAAPVTVGGVAKLGKGRKAKLNGGTQSLVPGALGKFTLFFTKGLKKKLKDLPPKRSVRLNVTISGTNVAGAVTTKTLKLKLRGQAKP